MNITILYPLAYLVISFVTIYYCFKKTSSLTRETKITIRCAAIALFFSPALLALYVPLPAPPIIGLLIGFYSLTQPDSMVLFLPSLLFAAVPFTIFWLLYVFIYTLIEKVYNKSLNRIGAKNAPPG